MPGQLFPLKTFHHPHQHLTEMKEVEVMMIQAKMMEMILKRKRMNLDDDKKHRNRILRDALVKHRQSLKPVAPFLFLAPQPALQPNRYSQEGTGALTAHKHTLSN